MLQCPCDVCDSNLTRAIEQDDVGFACKSHGPPVAVRLSRPDADPLCRTLRLLIVLLRSFIESRCVRLDLRRYITHPVEREQLPTDGSFQQYCDNFQRSVDQISGTSRELRLVPNATSTAAGCLCCSCGCVISRTILQFPRDPESLVAGRVALQRAQLWVTDEDLEVQ